MTLNDRKPRFQGQILQSSAFVLIHLLNHQCIVPLTRGPSVIAGPLVLVWFVFVIMFSFGCFVPFKEIGWFEITCDVLSGTLNYMQLNFNCVYCLLSQLHLLLF